MIDKTKTDTATNLEQIFKDEQSNVRYAEAVKQGEVFYQEMLAQGISKKEDYNVVPPGDARSRSACLLVK